MYIISENVHPVKVCTPMYTTNQSLCDGWSRVSFEECKQKCRKNELPDNCKIDEPLKSCAYAVWIQDGNKFFPPGWCQFAEINCELKDFNWGGAKTWENPDYGIGILFYSKKIKNQQNNFYYLPKF